MFKLFPKKNNKANIATAKEFVIVKSFYGISDHIALNNKEAKPLCEYKNGIVTDATRNKEEIVKTFPNQHPGFMWCADCAHEATGVSVEEISVWRNNQ